jgi:hypothetical protein
MRVNAERRKLKGICMYLLFVILSDGEGSFRLITVRSNSRFFAIAQNDNGVYFKLPIISSGLTHWSNCSLVNKPSDIAASRRDLFSLSAVLAIFAAFS